MSLEYRETWTVIHGLLLGTLFLLAFTGVLVPRQATFARFTSSRSVLSWVLRFRHLM